MDHQARLFVCTECGSFEASAEVFPPPADSDAGPWAGPWAGIPRLIVCARCGFAIPAHLGERQDGLTIEQARQAWLDVFQATAMRRSGTTTPMETDLRREVVLRGTVEELRLRDGGIYRMSREIDYRRCYRLVDGERLFDDAEPPLEIYSSEYIGGSG